jgi:hypothetical protein
MKVVCINSNYNNPLTYGKIYDIIISYKDEYDDIVYVIKCEDDEILDLPPCLFISIEEWRDIRLQDISKKSI